MLGDAQGARSLSERAEKSYERAFELYKQIGDLYRAGSCLALIGELAEHRGERAVARERFEHALVAFETRGGANVAEACRARGAVRLGALELYVEATEGDHELASTLMAKGMKTISAAALAAAETRAAPEPAGGQRRGSQCDRRSAEGSAEAARNTERRIR